MTPDDIGKMTEVDRIVEHLRGLVFNDKRGQKSILRQGFEQLAGERIFTRPQMRALFNNASETGRSEIDGSVLKMWHFFHDGLSKMTMAYDVREADHTIESIFNSMVISKWNAQNFPKILEYADIGEAPAYPATLDQLSDFRVVPAYIDRSVMPILKRALADQLGVDLKAVETRAIEREAEFLRDGVPGYEALKPMEDWPLAKKTGSQAYEIGPAVKPL